MKRASTKWVLLCFAVLFLTTTHTGCGRIMHFFNPQPPPSNPEVVGFAGQISSVSAEKFFVCKDFGGNEWKIWVNEDTLFYTSQYVDTTKSIAILKEQLEKDTEKAEYRFEDLRPDDICVVWGQVKKPAKTGETGELLAMSVYMKNEDKLVPYSIYYNNTIKDPNMLDCSKVYPVGRMADEKATYEEILLLLFEDPTEEEKKQGYVSAIPDDVVINFIVRNDGVMQVDFKPFQIAGACATAAFSAQVKQTLLSIPGTKEVIISIMNETEGILQP